LDPLTVTVFEIVLLLLTVAVPLALTARPL